MVPRTAPSKGVRAPLALPSSTSARPPKGGSRRVDAPPLIATWALVNILQHQDRALETVGNTKFPSGPAICVEWTSTRLSPVASARPNRSQRPAVAEPGPAVPRPVDLVVIKEFLGHAHIGVSATIYAHVRLGLQHPRRCPPRRRQF